MVPAVTVGLMQETHHSGPADGVQKPVPGFKIGEGDTGIPVIRHNVVHVYEFLCCMDRLLGQYKIFAVSYTHQGKGLFCPVMCMDDVQQFPGGINVISIHFFTRQIRINWGHSFLKVCPLTFDGTFLREIVKL
jgi:hypothetical protein